jgi:hypothetical protein
VSIVRRDPFARQELHKAPVWGTCAFCGGSNRYGKVWRYRVENDGGRTNEDQRVFCCVGCREAFYGVWA